MSNFRYYVYAYIRKSNGTPYYIGKGCDKRAYRKHRNVTTPKDITKIILLETNLSDVGALALERRYIRWYGRKDINTGILHNKTEGGDGASYPKSDAHKQKIRESNIGKKHSVETKQKMRKHRHTEEAKIKIKEARSKQIITEEHKQKISDSLKLRNQNSRL